MTLDFFLQFSLFSKILSNAFDFEKSKVKTETWKAIFDRLGSRTGVC